jgi:hypothetical protein
MTYAAKKNAALASRRIVLPAPNAAGISDLFELSVDIFGASPIHTLCSSAEFWQDFSGSLSQHIASCPAVLGNLWRSPATFTMNFSSLDVK